MKKNILISLLVLTITSCYNLLTYKEYGKIPDKVTKVRSFQVQTKVEFPETNSDSLYNLSIQWTHSHFDQLEEVYEDSINNEFQIKIYVDSLQHVPPDNKRLIFPMNVKIKEDSVNVDIGPIFYLESEFEMPYEAKDKNEESKIQKVYYSIISDLYEYVGIRAMGTESSKNKGEK